MKYLIEDTRKVVTEEELRKLLYEYEVEDLLSNKKEYLQGDLNLNSQFECINSAKNADIKIVINMLEENWNVPIGKFGITLTEEEKETIKKAYIGDLTWLDTIRDIIKEKENNDEILELLNTIYKMNYIVIETETEKYASKYDGKAHDLYSEMKIDLMQMLNYEEMWEEI